MRRFEQNENLIRGTLAQNSQTIWLQVQSSDRKLNLCCLSRCCANAIETNQLRLISQKQIELKRKQLELSNDLWKPFTVMKPLKKSVQDPNVFQYNNILKFLINGLFYYNSAELKYD